MNPKHPLDPPMTLGNMRLMVRDTAYWYGRGTGCLWAKAGSRGNVRLQRREV